MNFSAIKVTLQELPSPSSIVKVAAMLGIRSTLPRRRRGTIVNHETGHSEIDVVSRNDSIDHLRRIRTSEKW